MENLPKPPNLEFITQPKQLLGYLLLDIMLMSQSVKDVDYFCKE